MQRDAREAREKRSRGREHARGGRGKEWKQKQEFKVHLHGVIHVEAALLSTEHTSTVRLPSKRSGSQGNGHGALSGVVCT
jgi:hypothetical protein